MIDLRPNCIAHWKMNDNAANDNVVDSSGNGLTGHLRKMGLVMNSSECTYDPGKINRCFEFDSTNHHNYFVNHDVLLCPTQIGIAIWFRPVTVTSWWTLIGKAGLGQGQYVIDNRYDYDTLRFGAKIAGTFREFYSNDGTVQANQWQLVVANWDGSKATIYHNNIKVCENTDYSGDMNSGNRPLYVGRRDPTLSGNAYFSGRVDNLIILERAFSEDEVGFLWNHGDGTERLVSSARPLVGGHLAGKRGLA